MINLTNFQIVQIDNFEILSINECLVDIRKMCLGKRAKMNISVSPHIYEVGLVNKLTHLFIVEYLSNWLSVQSGCYKIDQILIIHLLLKHDANSILIKVKQRHMIDFVIGHEFLLVLKINQINWNILGQSSFTFEVFFDDIKFLRGILAPSQVEKHQKFALFLNDILELFCLDLFGSYLLLLGLVY